MYDLIQDKKIFNRLVLILLALLSLFVLVKIVGEARSYRFIGSNPEVRSAITVTGEGEIFAIPDIASFGFGATAQAKSAKEAQDAVVARINPAIKFLRDNGVAEKDIKTSSFNVYPQYTSVGAPCTQYSCPPSRQEISGYEASQYVEVKIRNIETAGGMIAGITEAGANNVSGLNFTIDEEDSLKAAARAQAIADAKSKAVVLAKDLNVKLVRIVEFSENNWGGVPPYMKFEMAQDARGSASSPDLPTGENKIFSSVVITYEIR
jgi:uncharacterized protein